MDRREAIKRAALLVGGSVLMPDILKAWSSPTIENQSFRISLAQEATLAEVCETIIPTTDTPGAKAAGVPDFVKKMLADCYEKEQSTTFMKGLDKIDADAQSQFGKSFANITSQERIEIMKQVEKQAIEDRKASPKTPQFFFLAKELTILGFFTSEIGCTQVLRYEPVPGRYDGAFPYKKGDKAWAT